MTDPGSANIQPPGATAPEPHVEATPPSVADRVERIVGAAERAAENFRRESDMHAVRQAAELRETAEIESQRLRRETQAQVATYLSESRRRIDAYASERIGAIAELTERLIDQADAVERRFDAAEQTRRQVYDLIGAIGAAAEAVAAEAGRADPQLPSLPNIPAPAPTSSVVHAPAEMPVDGPAQTTSEQGDA